MALPILTAEQRCEDLRQAQEARTARKLLLAQVKFGAPSVAQMVDRGKADPMGARPRSSRW